MMVGLCWRSTASTLFHASPDIKMSTRHTILKFLTGRGVNMYDESEFVKDNDKEPAEEGTSWTYFARRAKVPDEGGRVCVKVLKLTRDDFMRQLTSNECAGKETWHYFRRECCISKRIEVHPNIQTFLGVVNEFDNSALPGLVFKEVAVGDFQTFVFEDPRATTPTKLQLMRDVATGLAFLHERGIIHRKLRCSKILVDIQDSKLTALLSDFSSAQDVGGDIIPNECYLQLRTSLPWTPPEYRQFGRISCKDDYDFGAGDMWSFGCIMVQVLARTVHAWPSDYTPDMISRALNLYEKPPRLATFPLWDDAWNLIHDRCWNLVPPLRITARKAIVELDALLKTAALQDEAAKPVEECTSNWFYDMLSHLILFADFFM